MAKYKVSGKSGNFVTTRRDTRVYYKVGDFTNATGTITSIKTIKPKRKVRRRTNRFGFPRTPFGMRF